jgi:hypothetical protein
MKLYELALVVLFISITAMAQEASRGEHYNLKRDVDFSSIYPRATGADVEGAISFDKPYGELTAAQQGRLKLAYVALGDGDEPPFPIQGLGAICRPVSKGQQRLLVGGEFRAEAESTRTATCSPLPCCSHRTSRSRNSWPAFCS